MIEELSYLIDKKALGIALGRHPVIMRELVISQMDLTMMHLNNHGHIEHLQAKLGSSMTSLANGDDMALKGAFYEMICCNLEGEIYDVLDFDISIEITPNDQLKFDVDANYLTREKSNDTFYMPRLKVFTTDASGQKHLMAVPLQYVLVGSPLHEARFMGYLHGIALDSERDGSFKEQHFYAGITKRNWLKRMYEHIQEIGSGSNKLFHRAWRQAVGNKKVLLTSQLSVIEYTYKDIMDWEEGVVDNLMSEGRCLNMIAGGFKGLKELHKHGFLKRKNAPLEQRDKALLVYQKANMEHSRKGIPNLLMSNLWKDDKYAEKVICGPDNRLSAEQVIRIREHAEQGISPEDIVNLVSASNIIQVKNVISGKYYSRIRSNSSATA